MLTKRVFYFRRGDQSTVDFLNIHRPTQNMQEPISIQTTKIAGIIPSLLKTPGTETGIVTISGCHGRGPHLDNAYLSRIHQAPVDPAKPDVNSRLNAAGG